jgi:uncharacterized protein
LYLRINQIYYILGYACDLNCKYCAESFHKNAIVPAKECGKSAEYFIRNLLHNESQRPIKFTFYGGEPLIYWDDLIKVHQKFKNEPMADFYVFTNGKALTQDKVDYLNKNNFQVILSWDGRNVEITRGHDSMKDNRDLFLQLNRLAINGIGSAYNYPLDFVEDMDDFDKDYYEIHKWHIQSSFTVVEDEAYNVDDLIDVDIDKWRSQSREIAKRALNAATAKEYSAAYKVYLKDINRSTIENISVARCGYGTTIPVLDGDGNLYLCQNV